MFFLLFSVVNNRSAVVGTVIYTPLICVPGRLQEDGQVMEYCPFHNIVVYRPKSKVVERQDRKLPRSSMQGSTLIALYDVDEAVMRGSNSIVVS